MFYDLIEITNCLVKNSKEFISFKHLNQPHSEHFEALYLFQILYRPVENPFQTSNGFKSNYILVYFD